jgi:outer membrane lipoprotein-sorting protein
MNRIRVAALALGVLFVASFFASAGDPDLKAILKKSIAAHGGDKNLAKYKAAHTKFKGSLAIGDNTTDVTGETFFHKPDKVKNTLTLDVGGMQVNVITVFDGTNMWVSANGDTKEIKDDRILKEIRENLQVEGAGGLSDFLEKPYQLNSVGEVKVKDKAAIGIRVSKEGQRDFTLFFDKQTNLIVKTEMRALNAMTNTEVTQEKFILDYQEKNGIKMAKRVEIHNDGKLFMSLEIGDVQILEKLDATTFAKP